MADAQGWALALRLGTLALLSLAMGPSAADPARATEAPQVTVRVDAAPKQVFAGFGASQPTDQGRLFTHYGHARVSRLAGAVYSELGMNMVRLWVHAGADLDVGRMKRRFKASYLNNGYLALLQRAGAKAVLLAPARGEGAPDESMQEYATKLATFIRDIQDEHGLHIHATGVANEPAGFSAIQLRDAVRLLREALDMRGLHDVAIIAPECASPDACATRAISEMKRMPSAWRALSGVATHSYNMGANSRVEALVLGTGKDYWMTEAGRALPRPRDGAGRAILVEEEPGETAEAATTAARFLNDMNHSVTHWFWFIGIGAFDQHPAKDSAQVLARPDDATGGIKYNTKYHYLWQLRRTFELGARFHGTLSDREGRMTWDYGQKPAITVAAAQNPDGSWGVGVANTTGIRSTKITRFHPAATWTVRIILPEAARGQEYAATRSRHFGPRPDGVVMPDPNGVLEVRVGPHELLTLRSQ
ncbi:MAG: hypothetical protein KDE68_01555 [Rhodocyclaceae bacterium]|nr:hypothetical protein [Rhodocyclaceae bacterium]